MIPKIIVDMEIGRKKNKIHKGGIESSKIVAILTAIKSPKKMLSIVATSKTFAVMLKGVGFVFLGGRDSFFRIAETSS